MMSRLFLLAACTLLFACKNPPTENEKAIKELPSSPNVEVDQDMTGEWRIFAWGRTESMVHCNACPTVWFRTDGSAVVTLPGSSVEQIQWSAKNGRIRITNPPVNKKGSLFDDGEYIIILRDGELDGVELVHAGGSNIYHLGKISDRQ
jgi:hypothetical protein